MEQVRNLNATRSAWTHAICDPCFYRLRPKGKPVRLIQAKRETCCQCGFPTLSGIYFREHPALMECLGDHGNGKTLEYKDRSHQE